MVKVRELKPNDKEQQTFKRLNFLYQAAALPTLPPHLRHFYRYQLTQLSQKKVVRLSRQVRQEFCKRCLGEQTSLGTVRIEGKVFQRRKCCFCGQVKNIFIAKTQKPSGRADED